jgi:hypothetical protein
MVLAPASAISFTSFDIYYLSSFIEAIEKVGRAGEFGLDIK